MPRTAFTFPQRTYSHIQPHPTRKDTWFGRSRDTLYIVTYDKHLKLWSIAHSRGTRGNAPWAPFPACATLELVNFYVKTGGRY